MNDEPTVEEMSSWSNERIGLRMFILGLMCADREKKQDDAYHYADRELRKMASLVNERAKEM